MANQQYIFCCYFQTFLETRPQGSIFHSKAVPRYINRISLKREFLVTGLNNVKQVFLVCGHPLILTLIINY